MFVQSRLCKSSKSADSGRTYLSRGAKSSRSHEEKNHLHVCDMLGYTLQCQSKIEFVNLVICTTVFPCWNILSHVRRMEFSGKLLAVMTNYLNSLVKWWLFHFIRDIYSAKKKKKKDNFFSERHLSKISQNLFQMLAAIFLFQTIFAIGSKIFVLF